MFYLLNRHQHSTLTAHWSEPWPAAARHSVAKTTSNKGAGRSEPPDRPESDRLAASVLSPQIDLGQTTSSKKC